MKNKTAWIGAAGIVLAAIITGLFTFDKRDPSFKNQIQSGNNSTNIIFSGGESSIGLIRSEDKKIIDAQLNFLSSQNTTIIDNQGEIIELVATINQLRTIQLEKGEAGNKSNLIINNLSNFYSDNEFRESTKKFIDSHIKSDKSCDRFGKDSLGCSSCFDKTKPLYKGDSKSLNNTFNAGNKTVVYFLDENEKIWESTVLQQGSVWFTSTDMFQYASGLSSGTSKEKRPYFYFEPKTQTKYVISKKQRGIRHSASANSVNREEPAYRFKFKINYHEFEDGTLGPLKTRTTCSFYYAAWCGDGIKDTNSEACDDGNYINNDSCNNNCQANN